MSKSIRKVMAMQDEYDKRVYLARLSQLEGAEKREFEIENGWVMLRRLYS